MNPPPTHSEKNKRITAALALLGALQPTPVPLAGIHKFYLGQYSWGVIYLLLGATQLPRIACAAEGLWCLAGPRLQQLWAKIDGSFSPAGAAVDTAAFAGETVNAVASSLREIEQLRQEGLISEYEFEQKRRSLLEQMP